MSRNSVRVFSRRAAWRALGFTVACFGLASFAAIASAQTTITEWTFESDAIAQNNNPVADKGVGTASAIGMGLYPTPNDGVNYDDVLKGKSSDTGANGEADTSQQWRVRAQGGSSNTPAANGWSSAAPIGTQGAVFAASTVGYNSISVQFDWYSTTQGEANLMLQYTTNGTTWTDVPINIGTQASEGLAALTNSTSPNTVTGPYISDNLLTNGSLAGQDWFQGLTATISDPLAANNPNFAIEMVNASTGADNVSTQGTALNNSSGNWRFDRVSIIGVATPEPASCVMAGFGLAGVLFYGWRRRRAA
jgi:PEP-CTERM motif